MANKLFHGDPGDGLPSVWDVVQVNSFSTPIPSPHPQIPNLGRGHAASVAGASAPNPSSGSSQSAGTSGFAALPRINVVAGLIQAITNANFSTVTSSTYSVANNDDALWFDATSAAITVTLPSAAATTTQRFLFLGKKDSSVNAVTLTASGSDTILGASSLSLSGQYDAVLLVTDGSGAWVVYARFWGKQSANKFFASPNGSTGLPSFRSIEPADLPIFVGSGASHAAGAVPDPGSTAGTSKYLREDASFQIPPGMSNLTYVATANSDIVNTVTETSMIGTGAGTMTIPANGLGAGTVYLFTLRGKYSTTAPGPNITIKIKFGSTVILSTGAIALPASITSLQWRVEGIITCRSTGGTGTVYGQGLFTPDTTSNQRLAYDMSAVSQPVTIDTTASQTVDVTAQWGTANASNDLLTTQAYFQVMDVSVHPV